jgi:hypothetical protein
MEAIRSFLISGIVSAALLSPSARADVVRAAPSDSFVNFLGVQGHLHREGTIWETQAATLRARVGEIGIRYMRTQIRTSSVAHESAAALFGEHGVRLNVVFHPLRSDGSLNPTQIDSYLAFLRDQVGVEKILSIEGPNEYSSTKYDGNADWATELRGFQNQLYSAVKADSRLNSLPVVAPSIWRRIESDYNELGNLGNAADLGNLHYFNGGRKPTRYNRVRFFGDEGIESRMDRAISNARITTPGKRVFVTEARYNVFEGAPVLLHVPERTAAKYVLRLVSEFFVRQDRVAKAFIASLIDGKGVENQYGLLRRDLSRRPAFFAVKNAIKILSDEGPNFSPGRLTYTLSGDLSHIHFGILQKRDRRFYLMIWNDAVSWDQERLVETNPPSRRLTLDVSEHRFRTMRLYLPTALDLADPNRGALPIQTIASPRAVVLSVPDHVLIAEMIP